MHHVKHIYAIGVERTGDTQGPCCPAGAESGRTGDHPNTSSDKGILQEIMGADLSFARVRRPADNTLTERFFGTAKQEEIYVARSYPDERSTPGREESVYTSLPITTRDLIRACGTLPLHMCTSVNNNTVLLKELEQLKHAARFTEKRILGAPTISRV